MSNENEEVIPQEQVQPTEEVQPEVVVDQPEVIEEPQVETPVTPEISEPATPLEPEVPVAQGSGELNSAIVYEPISDNQATVHENRNFTRVGPDGQPIPVDSKGRPIKNPQDF